MRKAALGLVSCMAAVPVALPSPAAAAPLVVQGRCHMNVCSWMKLVGKQTVEAAAVGTLVRARIAEGGSEQPKGTNERKRPIEWQGPTDYFVLCSKAKPAVTYKNEGGSWDAALLAPGYPDAVAGATEFAYKLYFLVCHGVDANLEDASLGRKYGYPPSLVAKAQEAGPMTLKSPEDLLRP